MRASTAAASVGLVLSLTGCAQSVAGVGSPTASAQPSTMAEAPTTPSTPAAAQPEALAGKTWYLITVHRLGTAWTPGVVSTLTLADLASAQTNDGVNDTSWQVTLAPGTATWKQLETTAVAESALSLNVYEALSATLAGRTSWSVRGDLLTVTGASGSSLDYSDVESPAPKPYSGAVVFLDNDPPGGKTAGGQSLSLIAGEVTITNAQGVTAWSGQVTPDFGGDSKLPPGPYTITAVVQGGTCTPLPVTIVADQVGEFTLVCTTTQPTVAQH